MSSPPQKKPLKPPTEVKKEVEVRDLSLKINKFVNALVPTYTY
jgi:hypothetical protein